MDCSLFLNYVSIHPVKSPKRNNLVLTRRILTLITLKKENPSPPVPFVFICQMIESS